jgi:hypothetical protein
MENQEFNFEAFMAKPLKGRSSKRTPKEDPFLEAKRKEVEHYQEAYPVSRRIKEAKKQSDLNQEVVNKIIEKNQAPVVKVNNVHGIIVKVRASGVKEVHLPAGQSGQAYNKYRDLLI